MAGLGALTEALFTVELVKVSLLPAARPHDFNMVICAECGEVTVKRYARVKGGKVVCIPCAEKRLARCSSVLTNSRKEPTYDTYSSRKHKQFLSLQFSVDAHRGASVPTSLPYI